MPTKSPYDYRQVKDIAYKAISSFVAIPLIFRQLQYQSIVVFTTSNVQPNVIKKLLDDQNTYWHFIVISDNYIFNLTKEDKKQWKLQP